MFKSVMGTICSRTCCTCFICNKSLEKRYHFILALFVYKICNVCSAPRTLHICIAFSIGLFYPWLPVHNTLAHDISIRVCGGKSAQASEYFSLPTCACMCVVSPVFVVFPLEVSV